MKKSFSIIFIVFLSLGLVLARPFDIYANTSLSAPFLGVNIYAVDREYHYTRLNTNGLNIYTLDDEYYYCQSYGSSGACSIWKSEDGTRYQITSNISIQNSDEPVLYEYEFVLDGYYVGNVTINGAQYFVNGTSFKTTFDTLVSTFTISNLNLVKQQEFQWSWPNESAAFVFEMLYWDAQLYDLFGYYDFDIPMFQAQTGDRLFRIYLPKDIDYDIILIFNRSGNATNLFNYLVPEDATDLEIVSYEPINSDFILASSDYAYRYAHYVIKNTGSSRSVIFTSGVNNLRIVPIYLSRADIRNISTEFAQRNGISNQLLDDVHQIAQGTPSTDQSSSNLEDMNDDYDDVSQQVFGLENNFSTGFDSSMQNVPTTFNFGTQFGNKFLATATWVRNQFDTMTTNTPFGALITFSLVLGLALLIVGRRLL